jgi:hypothetical protein
MAAVTKIRASGALHTLQQITLRDVDGTERDIQFIKARDKNNFLQTVFLKPGAAPGGLTITPSSGKPSGSGVANLSQNSLTLTATQTVNVTGGAPPYTYLWTCTGLGQYITFAPTNGPTVTWTAVIPRPNNAGGYYNCLVTDANGLVVNAQFTVSFDILWQTS